MPHRHHRAAPLPPDDRRKSIVDAVVPLLIEYGPSVTTRQIAAAAGVAEGTIFRVFDDKTALVLAAVHSTIDPDPVLRALADIYEGASLEVKMAEAARILQERSERIAAIVPVLRSIPEAWDRTRSGPPAFVVEANAAINDSLTRLFDAHRDRLRIEPAQAAMALRSLIFASGHLAIAARDRLSIHDAVSILTSGILEPVSV